MTNEQWETLKRVVRGEAVTPLPIGFIIDSPWLPGWHGASILDYFSNDAVWLEANLKALREFPDVMFLPGFWSEYGMCTEPSSFGSRCTFPANEFPFAHKILKSIEDADGLRAPNPRTDGLLPFTLNRLRLARPKIEAAGHHIRFAVARGPLNIASHLMGTTEFLTEMMIEPEKVQALLKTVTSFLKDWLHLQRETFPTIDGIFLLDDIIGFLGEKELCTFALPYFKDLFDPGVSVRFLHNDAPCRVCAPYLPEMNVNLFNMGFDVPLAELRELTGNQVALMGNLPPRDVLAAGVGANIAEATARMAAALPDKRRILFSCGGGMPPGVSSDNIRTFINALRQPSH